MTGFAISAVVCAVIFVNGATDAPNSISGVVASGAMRYRSACILCAVCNFLGLALSYALFPAVARTVSELEGADSVVPLVTVIVFALAAWAFGIPTSESHALIAAMGGVSLYSFGTPDGKFIDVCIKSFCSCAVGFAAGAIIMILTASHFSRRDGSSVAVMYRTQRLCAALSSMCHGMQDGQKFIVLLVPVAAGVRLPVGAVLLCAVVMGIGCLAGGRKITETVGSELVEGDIAGCNAASDIGAVICTVGSSLFGIPVSTTYMKTCSLLGAATAGKLSVNKSIAKRFFATWALTYPVCMALAYVLSYIADKLF